MAGTAQNGQKRLIFIVIPQVRTKMREKGKREKTTTTTATTKQQQNENE